MTPQEFQTKLEELIKQAPKESTVFLTSTNKVEGSPQIFFTQGPPITIIADITLFASKDDHVKRFISQSAELVNSPYAGFLETMAKRVK